MRLRELFDAALDLDPVEREAYIDAACGDNAALREELRQLLLAHESSAPWLDRPVIEPPPAPKPWEGRQIGTYTVQKQLGSGGMGAVYLAERAVGRVRQEVAIKLISPVFLSNAEMVRRFEQEREILASLDHANIARLLDLGSTAEGIPYLVMEYVAGEPIDTWCSSRNLPIPDRLNLFRTVCAAVAYAHGRGVVHRDLKPTNILITNDGTPKLLDFGIAKVLRTGSDTVSFATRTGASLMTIGYASPEQVLGAEIGPASDIYSLGVILYELLTGQGPYRTEGSMIHEVARAICEEDPVPPSAAATALRRTLSGDLDAIILKALRKPPQWRYQSADALSEDIRRHLSGERVSARHDTLRYRLERIVHRVLHPANVVFHTHGVIMLTSGLLGFFLLLERHQLLTGQKAKPNIALDASILAIWILWSIWERQRMERAGLVSSADRLSWTVFSVIAVVAGAVTVVSAWRRFFPAETVAVFWNAALSIGLLVVGLQASRLMFAGGVVLLLSAILAIVYPASLYLWLAGGMIAGIAVPGVIFTLPGLAGNRAAERS
jgi:predicted Ser/Thr protein kinase